MVQNPTWSTLVKDYLVEKFLVQNFIIKNCTTMNSFLNEIFPVVKNNSSIWIFILLVSLFIYMDRSFLIQFGYGKSTGDCLSDTQVQHWDSLWKNCWVFEEVLRIYWGSSEIFMRKLWGFPEELLHLFWRNEEYLHKLLWWFSSDIPIFIRTIQVTLIGSSRYKWVTERRFDFTG